MGFKQQFNIRMCPRIGQLCPHSWPFQIGSREHVEDMSISIQNLDLDGKQKHHCHSFPHKLIQWLSPATDSENGEAGRTCRNRLHYEEGQWRASAMICWCSSLGSCNQRWNQRLTHGIFVLQWYTLHLYTSRKHNEYWYRFSASRLTLAARRSFMFIPSRYVYRQYPCSIGLNYHLVI